MDHHFSGTQDIPLEKRFNLERLTQWMDEHVAGFQGPLTARMFKGGQSNPTYLLSTPKRQYVMRSKPAPKAQLLPSAHAIEREFRVMNALSKSPVPVAEMLGLCSDEEVIGRAFFIMEMVQGRVFWDQSLPELDTQQRELVYREMNAVISHMHTLDVEAHGLSDYGRPGNYFERQITRWSQQYVASETQEIPEMHRLIEWLPKNLPASASDTRACLVHGDFRMDNLIFDESGSRILAVLDWELSTLGHPLADFSYHCMSWHVSPERFRGILGFDLQALGIPMEEQYIRWYCENTGLFNPKDLQGDWAFFLSYNMFRMAAILQGIAKRAQVGTASSTQALEAGERARPMAELAWKYAQMC
jgi:aminoglycoside phosphotransferase (APT) family kinase protein